MHTFIPHEVTILTQKHICLFIYASALPQMFFTKRVCNYGRASEYTHPNPATCQQKKMRRYQNEYCRKTTGYISFKISILVFDILTVLKKGYFFLSLPLKVMWKYHHRTPLCWAEKWRRVYYTLERKVKGLWGECFLIQQNKRDCN